MKKTKTHRRGAKLGQHFLTGRWAARKLAEAARITSRDTVLEVGPGKGALTKVLLETGGRVIAIEKDPALVDGLGETFRNEIEEGALKVVEEDIRNIDLKDSKFGSYVVAANIPYYITGEIIRLFLSAEHQPKTMALLVQKEVAERIVARNGKGSILSISVKAYGKPEIAAKVPRGNFSPPPSVDSAILVVSDISKEFFAGLDEKLFFEIVRAGFSSKRKFLANNLGIKFGKENAMKALVVASIDEKARAENVSLEKWRILALQLSCLT